MDIQMSWLQIQTSEKTLSLGGGHLVSTKRNLYAGQEATVRTRHGTTDWFQIGKGGVASCNPQGCNESDTTG